jgi:hypothetical protein
VVCGTTVKILLSIASVMRGDDCANEPVERRVIKNAESRTARRNLTAGNLIMGRPLD